MVEDSDEKIYLNILFVVRCIVFEIKFFSICIII